jgi:hypothetical protein
MIERASSPSFAMGTASIQILSTWIFTVVILRGHLSQYRIQWVHPARPQPSYIYIYKKQNIAGVKFKEIPQGF